METPHRIVDKIAGGVVGAVQGLGNGAVGAVRGAGKAIMRGLDGPFAAITGKEGPHRIVDRLADGAIDAGVNLIDQGVIGTVKKTGAALMGALDHPIEQLGTLPKLPTLRK